MTIGIYRIFHIDSGKSYVGQSVRVEYRIAQHLRGLAKGTHQNRHLQSAYSLYGADAFTTSILEYCSNELLTEREQFWMDFYRPSGLYNLCPAAGSPLGYKHTEEAKSKIGKSHLGSKRSLEARQKMSNAWKSRVVTAETRKRISEAVTGRKYDEETRMRFGASHKKAVVFDGILYNSVAEAAAASGINRSTLRRQLISPNVKERYYA